MAKYKFSIRCDKCGTGKTITLDNSYWCGLERLEMARAVLVAPRLSEKTRQKKLAEIFSPHSYSIRS